MVPGLRKLRDRPLLEKEFERSTATMTLIIRSNYHALQAIEQNRIRWIPPEQAERQDIRPLRIGLLNIMPLGEQYEFNLLHPLGLSVLQIEPIWIRLESHVYKSWPAGHLDDLYMTYSEATRNQPLDGLIVTGAPVEHLPFEKVEYWDEISEVIRDSRESCPSTLGICWGGFALAYLEGVEKITLPQKLFGLFELENQAQGHPVMGALDDVFWCPQSRNAGLPDDAMRQAEHEGRLNLLAYGPESGYTIFETTDQRVLMHTGHPEYNAGRLAYEARRDQNSPEVPPVANFDFNNPVNRWRSHRNTFFSQWIHSCYTRISL
jgi:homoserine O-succinyltransferase